MFLILIVLMMIPNNAFAATSEGANSAFINQLKFSVKPTYSLEIKNQNNVVTKANYPFILYVTPNDKRTAKSYFSVQTSLTSDRVVVHEGENRIGNGNWILKSTKPTSNDGISAIINYKIANPNVTYTILPL